MKAASNRKGRTQQAVATKGDFAAVVVYNRSLGACNRGLGLRLPAEAVPVYARYRAGQFVEIDLSRAPLPRQEQIPQDLADGAGRHILLRRPFSFSNLLHMPDGLLAELIYCVVGPATLRMSSLAEGEQVHVLGPLGHGFEVPAGKEWALLVSGGMGAPPIQHLARTLISDHPGVRPIGFAGARSKEDLPFDLKCSDKGHGWFSAFGMDWQVATDDGSLGHKGFVTQCVQAWLGEHTDLAPKDLVACACGPQPMLAKVAQIAKDHGIDCQVSLERQMACGFGVCQACAVECREGQGTVYRLCCQDGPVMDASQVIF